MSKTEGKESRMEEKQLIYCGPNAGNGQLIQYALFRGGLPKHVLSLIEQCKAIGQLIVPITEAAVTIKAIKQAGTKQNQFYQDVIQYMGGDK